MTYLFITESKDEDERRNFDREYATRPGARVKRVSKGTNALMTLMQGGRS